MAILGPGTGKTHRAYLWACASGALESMGLVLYDFTESRFGEHPRAFRNHGTPKAWRGSVVCDDQSDYKVLFAAGISEMGWMAHARRKFLELRLT